MDVVAPDGTDVGPVIERLVALAYVPEGDLGVPGREAFKPPSDRPFHYLYVVIEGSKPRRDHIDLRDYLRRHLDEARRFAARKREIALMLTTDREAYVEAKNEIVEDLLRRGREQL